MYPTELRTNASGAKLSPQICPNNNDIVAYVCNFDIWVTHIATGNLMTNIIIDLSLLNIFFQVVQKD